MHVHCWTGAWPPRKFNKAVPISEIAFFSVGFDAMGLTDNENPIGLMPFLMPGLGVGAGRRRRRDLDLPEPDMAPKDVPGGERLDG